MTEVICTACLRHCLLGMLALTTIPKDSKTPVLDARGEDIRPYCEQNYIPE